MKVIFIKNFGKLGQRGDIKEVSVGYARNFLLPKGYVDIATPDNVVKISKEIKKKVAKKHKTRKKKIFKLTKKLSPCKKEKAE